MALNQNPPVHGVRPAIDVTMASVLKHYGPATIGVILTGMGNDGTHGCTLIHSAGGWVICGSGILLCRLGHAPQRIRSWSGG